MVRPNEGRGFTLLEVLLVVTLLALGAALVPPALRPWVPQSAASVADSMAALLTSTRATAVETNTTTMLVLAPSIGRWWRFRDDEPMDRGAWPTERARLLGADERVTLGFSPTGQGWAGAPIRFLEDGDTTTLAIDPWTGRVRLE